MMLLSKPHLSKEQLLLLLLLLLTWGQLQAKPTVAGVGPACNHLRLLVLFDECRSGKAHQGKKCLCNALVISRNTITECDLP
jgi:hypothetical protein